MIRYRRLAYLALNVSDLDRSIAFYRDVMGLQHVGASDAPLRFLRCSDKHHDIVLYRGDPGLKRIAFELESAAELPKLQAALQAAGVAQRPIPDEDVAAMRTGPGVRMIEPNTQATIDFFVAGPAGSDPYPPFVPTVAKIERLGHLVLKTARYRETVDFFHQVLNFQISDQIGEAVTFMRCFPNPLHHSFGLADGKGQSTLHHVNFMVTDIDDIGIAMWRFKRLDVPIVFGPGRHPTSNSIFLYALDPDGITVEYSFGMEQFPESGPRPPRLLPAVPKSVDSWESPIDTRKNGVGTIELPQ